MKEQEVTSDFATFLAIIEWGDWASCRAHHRQCRRHIFQNFPEEAVAVSLILVRAAIVVVAVAVAAAVAVVVSLHKAEAEARAEAGAEAEDLAA